MLNASHIGSGGEIIRCHGGDGDLTDLASRSPPPKHGDEMLLVIVYSRECEKSRKSVHFCEKCILA